MQAGLNLTDRKVLWIAAVLSVMMIVATSVLGPLAQPNDSPIPSSYAGTRNGALAAYLLLDERGFPVQRWLRSPSQLSAAENTVLVITQPTRETTPADRAALLAYVSKGGRILFTGRGLEQFLPLPGTEGVSFVTDTRYDAVVPSHLTHGAASIRMLANSQWTGKRAKDAPKAESSTLPLYGPADRPAVTVTSLGYGEVIWWAGTTPLTNSGIVEAQNLRMFLNAMSNPDGSPRSVFWDEYFHGDEGDLWSYVAKTPVPWGMWQLVLAAGVVLFTFSRRSGPLMAPVVQSRLSPLEFVDTMGQLYQRAGAASMAVEIPYLRLKRQLARRLLRESSIPDAELARLSAQRLGVAEAELRETLETARQVAAQPRANKKASLKLAQSLARFSRQFGAVRPIGNSSQEKPT